MVSQTVGQRISKAILMEATSEKAGNVHPNASFPDMKYQDFQVASEAIGAAFEMARSTGKLGDLVLTGVNAMMDSVGVNTSLGTILLLAPLALCPPQYYSACSPAAESLLQSWDPMPLRDEVTRIIYEATPSDSGRIYEAIRVANPGGLGTVDSHDISSEAPDSILQAMQQASSWDDVALQYSNGFQQVIEYAQRLLELSSQSSIGASVRQLQIEILASRIDSLIVRKLGLEIGLQVQKQAVAVLQSGDYGSTAYESSWSAFDNYLRETGKRKNPGTTADLIAAAIFVANHLQDHFDE